jgi:hypothetical protein
MVPTHNIGRVMKKATHAKNQNINQDTAANNTHINKSIKSAKTVRITETSQPKACLIW